MFSPKALAYRWAGPGACPPSSSTMPVLHRLYASHWGMTSPLPASSLLPNPAGAL